MTTTTPATPCCALCERPEVPIYFRAMCRRCYRKLLKVGHSLPPSKQGQGGGRPWSPDPMLRLLSFLRTIPKTGRLRLHQLLLEADASDPITGDLPCTAESHGSDLEPRMNPTSDAVCGVKSRCAESE